jgi:hypothetical protein
VLFLFLFKSNDPHAVGNFGWDPTISDASPPELSLLNPSIFTFVLAINDKHMLHVNILPTVV